MNNENIVFSCVVDDKPIFRWQGDIFIKTLIHGASVEPESIYIHVVDADGAYVEKLKKLGVNVEAVERWGDGKYCNKLAQFDNCRFRDSKYVFLCDCDLAFAGNVNSVADIHRDSIVGKVVDANNPPLEMLVDIFSRYELKIPRVVDAVGGKTFENNCNGGFLGIPSDCFYGFGRLWREYASQLLNDKEVLAMLGDKKHHVDQISFCMALNKKRFKFNPINVAFNAPTHSRQFLESVEVELDDESPMVVHYHSNFDYDGFLRPTGVSLIDKSIEKINRTIMDVFDPELRSDYLRSIDS